MKIETISTGDLTKHKNFDIIGESANPAEYFCVSGISPAIRNQNRVNISVNDKFYCSLDISQLADFKLKIGSKLSSEELAELKNASDFGKLYVRALEYALVRPRSMREMRDYLWKKTQPRLVKTKNYKTGLIETVKKEGYDKSLTEPVLSRLTERGFLSDEKFAKFWVQNRFVKKGTSRRRLEQELMKKGIDRVTIEQTLAESERNDSSELQKIIAKKRARYDDEKLIQYLIRQGFDYDSAKTAVRETD